MIERETKDRLSALLGVECRLVTELAMVRRLIDLRRSGTIPPGRLLCEMVQETAALTIWETLDKKDLAPQMVRDTKARSVA